jgi:hypothetical protein
MRKQVATVARKNGQPSATRRLHRSLGAGAALFVLFMVISGVAINHSNQLGLGQSHVSQPLLLDWYGLEGPEAITSFAVGDRWLSFAGSQLFLDGAAVDSISDGKGAVANGDILVAAGTQELLLMTYEGSLIERLPWDVADRGLIKAVGLSADGQVVMESGQKIWVADSQLLGWQQAGNTGITPSWSTPEPAPESLTQTIMQNYRGAGISLERLLLDLHSGRIFGTVGILVYDLLALAIGFLAISGLITWARSRKNGSRKRTW